MTWDVMVDDAWLERRGEAAKPTMQAFVRVSNERTGVSLPP